MRYEGPVEVRPSIIDPGDMGEPRTFTEGGVTYLTVPDPSCWPGDFEAAWAGLGLSCMDVFGIMWSSLIFTPGWEKGAAWYVRIEVPKPRTGRYSMYWRLYANGETPAAATWALAAQLRDLVKRAGGQP